MKKLISGLSAFALAGTMAITAFASEAPENQTIDQNTPEPKQAFADITTEIAPAYIVTIPADTKVKFNDAVTDFGEVELTKAQLDPGKMVVVNVSTDGELNNEADAEKIIPYTVTAQYASGAEEEEFVPFNTKGQPLQMDTVGQKFALTIEITEEDWNKAYAGKYSDTVTFDVSYEDAPSEPTPAPDLDPEPEP